ncbi:hypothetical protein F5X99DRAFT_158550 [Biscogniauxia marginata]|nr:hypothetical protein F5X99DRAFT_158550 [Biscogniauxia marginata]
MRQGATREPKNGITESQELMVNGDHGSPERPRSEASWSWEISTLTLSVLFFGAQIGILVYVHDKPYYEMWRFTLSLNTVLAILTAGYKASQLHAVGAAISQVKWIDFKAKPQRLWNFELYDESSRGPQGALEFLLRVPWGLATIGAIVTLLGLAADAFTQQVVFLEPRNVTTPDNSVFFGYSLEYDTRPNQTGLSSFQAPELSSRDPGIQGAIMKGIFDIKTAPEFQCGGACSWNGAYQSLGFSSTCENVTQATAATKVCDNNSDLISPGFCNMTTPGGVSFSTYYIRTDAATVLRVAVNESFSTSIDFRNGMKNGDAYSWRIPPDFLKVAIFRSTSGPDREFNDREIIDEDITECSLSLALHEYEGLVANGSELTIASHRRLKLEPGYSFTSSTGYINQNQTVTFNQSEAGLIQPQLSIGAYDWQNMVQFFESEAFTSHIIAGSDNGLSQVGIGGAFLHVDLPTTFDALAESMTDYVRSLASGPNVRTATGNRVEQVIFVHVRWGWLAFPLVVELTAVAFVLSVMVKNRRRGIPTWKSSALGLLSHHYSKGENAIISGARGPREVEKMAKQATVQLR